MSDTVDVLLPQWGMGMTEGTINEWYKQPGDAVAEGEPLAEIETAKASEDLTAPVAGVIVEIVAPVGEVVPVRGLVARITPE